MERVWNLLNGLRGRLWVIPAAMSIAALLLARMLLWQGVEPFRNFTDQWWIFSGDPGTARDLLSTLLSGMITMTSLVVSITVVVLSLAANQLGPRLIWNFIEDRRIQTVIGLFVATILYTLLVLQSLGDAAGGGIPNAAVTVSSLLTAACLFALLFYISLIARSIVSDIIVQEVADALDTAVGHLPERSQRPAEDRATTTYPHRCTASTGKSGYVQVIDYDELCSLASRHDLLVVFHIRAGHFVLRDTPHFEVRSWSPITDETKEAIAEAIVLGSGRTPTQDLEYSVRQLVEIAVRALSPSLNDPFTAIAVIDRLASALEIVARRGLPPKEYCDAEGRLRIIASTTDYEGLMDAAFNQIRQFAGSHASVLIQLAHRLADLMQVAVSPEQRQAIARHLKMVERSADTVPEPLDREDLLSVIAAGLGNEAGRGLPSPRARGEG